MKPEDIAALSEHLEDRLEARYASSTHRAVAQLHLDILRMGLGSVFAGGLVYGVLSSLFSSQIHPVTTAVSGIGLVSLGFHPFNKIRDVFVYAKEEGVNESAAKASLLR